MKTFKAKAGPFAERPFYTDADVETICSDELSKLGLLPNQPQPIRVDRFVERRFVTPSYEDLGEGILGLTKFSAKGVAEIIVSIRLDAEGSRVSGRRIRTTLAHEGGHGLLHTIFLRWSLINGLCSGTSVIPRNPRCCAAMRRLRELNTAANGGNFRQIKPWDAC